MNASKPTATRQSLIQEIRLARVRLAKAESQRKVAQEQARLAKRRRKAAKEAARRAKKKAKRAKRAVAEAKRGLAEAEKNYALAARRAARTRTRSRPPAKAGVVARRKKPVRRPIARSASPAASPGSKPVRPDLPKPGAARGVSGVKPAVAGERTSIAVPRDFEVPASPASPTPSETDLSQANTDPAGEL